MSVTNQHAAAVVPWVTQWEARRLLGDALVLRVSPRMVAGYVGPGHPLTDRIVSFLRLRREGVVGPLGRKFLETVHPQIIPSALFPLVVPVEQRATYRRMRELVRAGDDWRHTLWYRDWRKELERTGAVRRKKRWIKSIDELDCFFETEMLGLIRSLRTDGYREELTDDLGKGMIDAEGRLLQSSKGRHRFAAARELGVRRVPMAIVGIDRAWIRAIGGGFRTARRREVLREHLRHVEIANRLDGAA